MMGRRNIGISLTGLLATSALCFPAAAFAATPAPDFVDAVDANGVDLVSGLPIFSIDEGGIGSGPGAVRMQRTWAEGAGLVDNWSGGIYVYTFINHQRAAISVDGRSATFVQQTDGSWLNRWRTGGQLTVDGNGSYIYTEKDGTQVKFDNNPNGSSEYSCPGSNGAVCHVPLSITRSNGLKFLLQWEYSSTDSTPRLKSVSSSAGYSFMIAYASNVGSTPEWAKRTSVTFNNSGNPPSPAPTIGYAYPDSTTMKITDPAGRIWTLSSNASGQLVGVTRPGSSSANITYVYGADGTVSSSTKDGVSYTYTRSATDPITETVTNALLQQISVTSDPPTPYGLGGRPTSYTDALQHTTTIDYDSYNRPWHVTAPEGNKTTRTYDDRGNITQIDVTSKDGTQTFSSYASFDATCSNAVKCDKPNSTTDAEGHVTTYAYEPSHGGLLSMTPPSPATGVQPQTRFIYTAVASASGDLVYMPTKVAACPSGGTSCTTANEVRASTVYNANLLPTSITKGNSSGTLAATSTMTYDSRGNLLTVDGPLAGTADTTAYKYDAADQTIGAISPDPDGWGILKNRAVRLTYRPDGQVSKQELGTTSGQTDTAFSAMAVNQTVDVTFDANARPTSQKLSAGGTAYALTQTSYDALGRTDCSAVRMNTAAYGSLPASACTQTSGNADRISQVLYDAAGQVTDRKVAVGVTGLTATERHLTYNANGTVASLTDAKNNTTSYSYDGLDRLTKTTYPDTTHEDLAYDASSNVTSKVNRAGESIAFTYDALDRLTLKNLPGTEPDVSYGYDNLGRLTSASQTGNSLSFAYDALSRRTDESGPLGTAHSDYDLAGRRTVLTAPGGYWLGWQHLVTGELSQILESDLNPLASFNYDDLGNRTSLTYRNGTSTNWSHDPVSRLSSIAHDLAGTINDLTIGSIGYNPAGQIVSRTKSNGNYAWNGAAAANRTYTSNALNQYLTAGPASFTYDAKGNLTSDGTSTFTYSSENRLTSASASANGAAATLSYDPLGRLYQITTSSGTRRFVYDGLKPVAEMSSTGAILDYYAHGEGMDEPLVWYSYEGGAVKRFMDADERGSIVAASDDSGNPLAINSYDEYGIPGSGNAGRFQYTGQMWLGEVGLYYYKNRFYSPTLGRLLQTDPLGYAGDGPNLYAYVLNDPVNLIDPLGLEEGLAPGYRWCGPSCTYGPGGVVVHGTRDPFAGIIPLSWSFARISNPYITSVDDGPVAGGGASWTAPTHPPIAPPTIINTCEANAIKDGLLSMGVDAIGLIPGGGGAKTLARGIGHLRGYRGIVADNFGKAVVEGVDYGAGAAGAIEGAYSQNLLATGLAIASFVPVLNDIVTGTSIVYDGYKIWKKIQECP